MRLISQGSAITASILVNNAALAEKPEHSSSLCRVICESQDTYQIRVSVPDDCPEPIMVSVYLDGTMLKYRYPFWPGTTRLIEGFQQDDGSLFAFQFAAPPIQLLSEQDAQSASVASSDNRQAAVGTIKLVFNRATKQEQLSFPPARAHSSPHQQNDDARSSKRSKSQHGDSKTNFAQSPSPPSLGFSPVNVVTGSEDKKFWKMSLGTQVGPRLGAEPGPEPGQQDRKPSASSSRRASSGNSDQHSNRPRLETKWFVHEVVGELTFRYATSLSMRLQKLLSYSEPQDYYMISTKEFRSNNANAILVAVIDGIMRLDKHKGSISIDQLKFEICHWTRRPFNELLQSGNLLEFLQQNDGNFEISLDQKTIKILASDQAPIDVESAGLQQHYDARQGPRSLYVNLDYEEECANIKRDVSNTLETAIELD